MEQTNKKFTAAQIKVLTSLYNDYLSIDCDKDLIKRKLTLNDYHTIPYVYTDIQAQGKSETFMKNVADYFKKFGFTIKLKTVNFEISV